ncbi:helix-turn-helix transcriptional regulator [Streptomyces sp. NPDC004647]|uniref:response regulator transcription factor n=1 Tax=Streptomyces sp. NPDC004647 TaxID=3154671 RepID=UPI0033A62FED
MTEDPVRRIARWTLAAKREVIWSVNFTDRSTLAVDHFKVIDAAASRLTDRGVDVSLLCPPSVTQLPSMRKQLSRADSRLHVSVTGVATQGVLAIRDRSAAAIEFPEVNGPGATSVVVVNNPAVVEVLSRTLLGPARSSVSVLHSEEDARSAPERQVLHLMAMGYKDEVAARRASLSLRTYRRHVATIMKELGAESRFQAGVRAAQIGLLDDHSAVGRAVTARPAAPGAASPLPGGRGAVRSAPRGI